ncbi:hypothetical protein ABZ436_29330 [Micromonospora matsumotoense]|uniref:hypothetical protein n=1 Tax=Micromonospora matsumotoense TaxID=121616 RepID=UPI0034002FA5
MREQPNNEVTHRVRVFDLWLDCGHLVTVERCGWYPVSVPCCDRLGGTVLHGVYVPYASHVDLVTLRSERHAFRPAGSPARPDRLIGRCARTDDPYLPAHPGDGGHCGRWPAHVGATWSIDGSLPEPD